MNTLQPRRHHGDTELRTAANSHLYISSVGTPKSKKQPSLPLSISIFKRYRGGWWPHRETRYLLKVPGPGRLRVTWSHSGAWYQITWPRYQQGYWSRDEGYWSRDTGYKSRVSPNVSVLMWIALACSSIQRHKGDRALIRPFSCDNRLQEHQPLHPLSHELVHVSTVRGKQVDAQL